MATPIRVSQRTGWFRLPVTKARSKGQQAFRPVGNKLSTAERDLTNMIEQAFDAIPTEMFRETLDNARLAEYSRLVLSTLSSYAPQIQQILTDQYINSVNAGETELRALLSRSWSKIGKATEPLPSEAVLQWGFDGKGEAAQRWAAEESSKLVTNMTVGQQDTVRQVINTSYTAGRTPATSARVLVDTLNKVNPSTPTAQNLTTLFGTNMNGLTTRYEQAVVNRATGLAQSLADRGITGQKAVDKITADTQKYADRLRRSRSQTIARTEILRANNEGRLATFNAAADQGLLSRQHSRKIWSTSPMDVCPICIPLNGQTVALDAPFSTGSLTPPAHPNCRCSFDVEPNVQAFEPPKPAGSGTPEDPYRFGRGRFTPEGRAASEITLPTETPAPSSSTKSVLDEIIVEQPEPTGLPINDRQLQERVDAQEELIEFIDSKVVMRSDDGVTSTVLKFGEDHETKGGSFLHGGGSTETVITVRKKIGNSGVGGEMVSGAHEIGHRLDLFQGNFVTRRVWNDFTAGAVGGTTPLTAVEKAVVNFIRQAKMTPSIKRLIAENSDNPDWVKYATNPHEIFARAFAQYIADEMAIAGHSFAPAMKANILKEHLASGYQWKQDEFDILKPFIEEILRARGMI
jgi:hypothetical protein